jgi:hypothetical protein
MKVAIQKIYSFFSSQDNMEFYLKNTKHGHPDDQHSRQGAEDQPLPENV